MRRLFADGLSNPLRLAPALLVLCVAGCERDSAASGSAAAAKPAAVQAREVLISEAWCRSPPPGAPTAACYATLMAARSDRLTSVTTPVAQRTEIHAAEMAGAIMRMRRLEAGVDLPAATAVGLRPGGTHLMLVSPRAGLQDGGTAALTFAFASAPSQTVTVPVLKAAPAAHADAHDGP